ncbi:uncharacterized protein TNCV_4168011 [Trichonephila clavipes]|nr:uncharacterized protein TNCV_4168011 [Trichonephila clavipes]
MIAASPLSPDEYAMRIATQTESALICKEYSSSFIVSPIPVFPAPQRTPENDEAHFWLNGYVNKQNCRIWSEANPQVYIKTPLHPEKLTVWCASWAGGIIGPYFFKNNEGQIGLHPSQPWQSYARNHI